MEVDNEPNRDAERGRKLNQSVEHLELQLGKVLEVDWGNLKSNWALNLGMIAISVFWEDYGRKGSHQMITTQDYSVCQTIRK